MYHNLALHLDEQILRPDAEDSGSEHEIDIGNESGLVFRSFGWQTSLVNRRPLVCDGSPIFRHQPKWGWFTSTMDI